MNRLQVSYDLVQKWITKKAFVNWGEGNRWQVDPIELKKKSQNTYFPIRSDRIDSKWGSLSNMHGMFPLGQHPRGNPSLFGVEWTTTNEAINREPQRVATGATAAPTDTDHSRAYPGGGSSKKIMAVASTIFPPARSAKRDENQAIDPKHRGKAQDLDSCIAVTVPCVAFKGFLRPLKRSYEW